MKERPGPETAWNPLIGARSHRATRPDFALGNRTKAAGLCQLSTLTQTGPMECFAVGDGFGGAPIVSPRPKAKRGQDHTWSALLPPCD